MKRILALDIGRFTAFACNTDAGPKVNSRKFDEGRETSAPTLGRVKMERPEFLAEFWADLADILRSARNAGQPIDVVVYERPFCRGAAATRQSWGQAGVIEALATGYGCAVMDTENKTLKKWATSRGDGDKDDLLAAARRLGYAGDIEHEADAWVLLHHAIATLEFEHAEDT